MAKQESEKKYCPHLNASNLKSKTYADKEDEIYHHL
jgi:hypothetical protein